MDLQDFKVAALFSFSFLLNCLSLGSGGWFVEMALVDYASSDGEEGAVGEAAGEVSRQLMTLNSAPDVAAMDVRPLCLALTLPQAQVMCVPATTKEVFSNHTYEAMWAAEEVLDD